jgi:hypothetical protein
LISGAAIVAAHAATELWRSVRREIGRESLGPAGVVG